MSAYTGLRKYQLLDGGQVLVEEIPSEFSYVMSYPVVKRLFEALPSRTAKNALSKLHNRYWVFFDHDNQRVWSTKLNGNPDKEFMAEAFNAEFIETLEHHDSTNNFVNEYAEYVMKGNS